MNDLRKPTPEDVLSLLLQAAPKKVLAGYELDTPEGSAQFVAALDRAAASRRRDHFQFVEFVAEAVYWAVRTPAAAMLTRDRLSRIQLAPEMLRQLVLTAKIRDQEEASAILSEQNRERASGRFDPVITFARMRFEAGTWKSVRAAAKDLWPDVQAYAEKVGVRLSGDTGRDTLYKWLRLHVNSSDRARSCLQPRPTPKKKG